MTDYETLPRRIGDTIRERRLSQNMSVTALARASGLSKRMVQYYESGEFNPGVVALYRMADAMGCCPSDLLPEPPAVLPEPPLTPGPELPDGYRWTKTALGDDAVAGPGLEGNEVCVARWSDGRYTFHDAPKDVVWAVLGGVEATLRKALAEANLRVAEARDVRSDEEPWIWSDDDTRESIDSLGNRMVVRITGGHLRALLRGDAP